MGAGRLLSVRCKLARPGISVREAGSRRDMSSADVGKHGGEIGFRCGADSDVGGGTDLVGEAGGGKQGLAGNATGPSAIAAEAVVFDESGLGAEEGRHSGGYQAGGSGADDD